MNDVSIGCARRLLRFLKAREWSVTEAEKQLRETVEWRRTIDPLNIDCRWCHERPGYHCIVRIYTTALIICTSAPAAAACPILPVLSMQNQRGSAV